MARPRKDRGTQDAAEPSSGSPGGAGYLPQEHDVVRLHLAPHARFEGCRDSYPAHVIEIHNRDTVDCRLDDVDGLVARDISLTQFRVPRRGTEAEGWQGATWSPVNEGAGEQ